MGLFSGLLLGISLGIAFMYGWQYMMKYRSAKRIAKVCMLYADFAPFVVKCTFGVSNMLKNVEGVNE